MSLKMDALMGEINKKYKDPLISKGLADYSGVTRIPNTSPRMNYCTHGGLPEGKLIEYYGEEHGGKTTTALDNLANFQAIERQKAENNFNYAERTGLYCDVENRLDVEWARLLGVDIDAMYLFQPKGQSAEEIFQVVLDAISTGEVGFVVIDSLGIMMSKQAFEKTVADKTYGGIAMALTNFVDRVVGLASKHKCTVIGINQLRDDMNSMWGGTKTTGGRAWRHACSVRIQFSRGKFFDDKGRELTNSAENPYGNYVKFSITKLLFAAPDRRTGFYTLRYDRGIDYLTDLIEVAIAYELIDVSGAWYTLLNISENKIQGKDGVRKYLEENPDALAQLEELVEAKMQ